MAKSRIDRSTYHAMTTEHALDVFSIGEQEMKLWYKVLQLSLKTQQSSEISCWPGIRQRGRVGRQLVGSDDVPLLEGIDLGMGTEEHPTSEHALEQATNLFDERKIYTQRKGERGHTSVSLAAKRQE